MNITVNQLTKTYGPQRAVDGISFGVQTGEIVGFLGPNGAGKTTTMKVLTGYMAPSAGEVRIGDFDVLTQPERAKPHIGYLPENNPLYLDMPVLEYLAFMGELQGVTREAMPQRLRTVVRLCGLDREKHKKIGELSKGYRQRVGLAQALIHDPDILILDEPTTGLDPNQIVEIRHLIREIGQAKTVILSTHILPEVEATCDRILIINQGQIVADGTADSLRQQAEGHYSFRVRFSTEAAPEQIAQVLRQHPMLRGVERLPDLPNGFQLTAAEDLPFREELFRLCVANDWLLTELTPQTESLEDIFRALTK